MQLAQFNTTQTLIVDASSWLLHIGLVVIVIVTVVAVFSALLVSAKWFLVAF